MSEYKVEISRANAVSLWKTLDILQAMWLSQTLYSFKARGHGSELERPLLVVVRDVISEPWPSKTSLELSMTEET